MGGGIRMGNTCKPMAVSFQCMTKFTTNKKKKKKERKKESESLKSTSKIIHYLMQNQMANGSLEGWDGVGRRFKREGHMYTYC